MKNPPRFRTHLEGWRPTVALAGHIVVATFAGLRLVGGTVRSSQDASEQLTRQIVVSTCLLLDGFTFGEHPHKLWPPLFFLLPSQRARAPTTAGQEQQISKRAGLLMST
jgi:hypothetical protein